LKIHYQPQNNIDKKKWDHCIDTSSNGLVYAYSFYLDRMSKNWDALIIDDYNIVMPLTWNRKYSIHYLYQPFFCAQLGIFGNNINAEIVSSFLEHIPSKFKYWDFYLNRNNFFTLNDFPFYERSNYVLPLKESYEYLSGKYTQNHLRNIYKAIQQGNRLKKGIPISDVIALAQEQSKSFSPITKKDYRNFLALFEMIKQEGMAETYGVSSKENQLLASCAWIFSHNRAYYILVGNHPAGRTSGASHLLIDQFIKEHAGEDLLLDFEGSNVRSLAFFYKSFGATLEKYPGITFNKLPSIAKLFRK
jgi:hypothetical protein